MKVQRSQGDVFIGVFDTLETAIDCIRINYPLMVVTPLQDEHIITTGHRGNIYSIKSVDLITKSEIHKISCSC